MRSARAIALLYMALVIGALAYAAVMDFALRNDPAEHMMPNFILVFVCAPLDILAFYILSLLPVSVVEALGWGQVLLVAVCGAAQAAFCLWFTRPGTAWWGSA